MKFALELEKYRLRSGPYASRAFEPFGIFVIPGPYGRELRVIASSGDRELGILWEHVSVSVASRCPNWPEMCRVKSLFWDAEETVMQLHVPESRWINNHPHCLHLWRPLEAAIPLPPDETVGDKKLGVIA